MEHRQITSLKMRKICRWHCRSKFKCRKGNNKRYKNLRRLFGKYDVSEVENLLKGVKHSEEEIRKVLSNIGMNDYFANITVDNLIEVMF